MATIALPRPIASHQSSSTLGSLTSTITLDTINSQSEHRNVPIPNKHIPVCPPGPVSQEEVSTPPSSPGEDNYQLPQSLLSPPDQYPRLDSGPLSLYRIEPAELAAALDYLSRQPLPDPSLVFPWFHGLHPNNSIQQAFFAARRRALRKTPSCLRGITVVKADGDLNVCRLKGAVAPDEFLSVGATTEFLDLDPKNGFSVRNFQIQTAKAAMTSDIVVYGEDDSQVRSCAWGIATAQQRLREHHAAQGHFTLPDYNTFFCVSPFSEFETNHPDLVAVDSAGCQTGNVVDFFHQERKEMYDMTKSSEISDNVWMGPTPDHGSEEEHNFDILIECSDLGRLDPLAFRALAETADDDERQYFLEFPSSGSILAPTWSHAEADGILETCKWIYHLAHGTFPSDEERLVDDEGDASMSQDANDTHHCGGRPRTILIHCADGYTESTMLAIAYYSYSTGRPVPEAWLKLHTEKQRNFFAYTSDVALLSAIAPRLLRESPVCADQSLSDITKLVTNEPKWFALFDGSFPSRITNYMYLGNLTHANNPSLLKELGIGQILSVGEEAAWPEHEMDNWGKENVCVVHGVQDNGIDSLTGEFGRCLEFIDRGRLKGTATLVHCRVGVSRSATICIAEVMRSMNLSFPRAYCFVRARRLNVIIQPHLRFAYELLKWEEVLQTRATCEDGRDGQHSIRRELEWGEIAREVSLMNRPYAK
ncbi:hypothetical protein VTK73DRAFT_8980 [Phialemonium thermophilum]|uniref:Protein-tyrosine-phosphatase n=1 Tax=Phialemonium thermophilum TaxID=223376 RepID=A0ABR3XLP0_9PEZI